MNQKILILGAGLSGLVIGYRLKKAGIPFLILEARDRIGGRIHTKESEDQAPVDMGATWLGNQHRNLMELIEELDVKYFSQYMEGISFFQPLSTSPAQEINLPFQPPSYRISGGSSFLINSLKKYIGIENILLNETIKSIEFLEKSILVKGENEHKCSKVVLALPPKLWSNNIKFNPPLPFELENTALTTQTWMEEAIKVAITYKKPFWRINNQSGTLFSNNGPITELYDHCNAEENKYALCGFINSDYRKLNYDQRKKLSIHHLADVFGYEANEYTEYNELIWKNERHTSTTNPESLYPHQNNGNSIYRKSYFKNRLFISSSEASEIHSGFMEGAVSSANFVFERIKETITK